MPKAAITRINGAFSVQSNYQGNPVNPTNINGFYTPQLTTAQRNNITADNGLQNGSVVYDTTLNSFYVYQNGAWSILYGNISAATGVGLAAGNSPFSLPSGARAAVEVAGNQVNGFAYYDTTNNVIRVRVGGAWLTVTAA